LTHPETGQGRPSEAIAVRALIVHNLYQHAGGEDAVVREEVGLLRRNRVEVEVYERDNAEIGDMPRAAAAVQTIWSSKTSREVSAFIERFRPDVVHAHNTFPLISPSLYFAASRLGVPTVQTLHNFRLFCVQAMFLREGKVCEDCVGALPWRGITRRCYRGSATQSAVMVGMLGVHRAAGTYSRRVTRYIALNQFCRDKFVAAGLPAERIAIKPNFIDLPPPTEQRRQGGLFVGRLSPEKGVSTLAAAAATSGVGTIDVVGTGPQDTELRGAPGLRLLGWREPEETYERMRSAAFLVMPSLWYENFPRTLVEAFACGLPVIASRLGAMETLVRDGVTGLLFEPGNARDLAGKLAWAGSHPGEMRLMGIAARAEYEASYTSKINFSRLMEIYRDAIQCAARETAPALQRIR
jgi:glycosyltransferase involved in cell wall biosynthesis